ncbi:1093_t:CDS:2, partial [Paraglomus occultum]
VWDKPYNDWPSVEEFSEYLRKAGYNFTNEQVCNAFQKKINALRTLFVKRHPAQADLELQLKQRKKSGKSRAGCVSVDEDASSFNCNTTIQAACMV